MISNKIIKETRMLVDLFLKNKSSDVELSNMTGISSSTVGRRLTNKEAYQEAFGDDADELFLKVKNLRQENLKKAKSNGGKKSSATNHYIKDEEGKFQGSEKINLDLIIKGEKNQCRFLTHIILYFKLHLETISQILGMDMEDAKKYFFNNNLGITPSLMYLFSDDVTDQNFARKQFYAYYNELLTATKERNIERRKELIDEVTDKKFRDLKQTRKKKCKIDDDMVLTVLHHQIKYGISITKICDNFIHKATYTNRVNALLETGKYPLEKQAFETLCDYYKDYYFKVQIREDGRYYGSR